MTQQSKITAFFGAPKRQRVRVPITAQKRKHEAVLQLGRPLTHGQTLDVSKSENARGERAALGTMSKKVLHQKVRDPTTPPPLAEANPAISPSHSPAAERPVQESPGLSSYEQARLENIRRNREFMASIGLDAAASACVAAKPHKRPSSAVRKRRKAPSAAPVRRSRRLRAQPAPSSDVGAQSLSVPTQPPSPTEEERQFAPSLIAAYDASAIDADAAVGAPKRIPAARRLERLREVSSPFGDDSLKKSYSLAFGTECALLAAVGHGGRAAIFAASGASIGTPLMSWKAHRGWVASCTFVGARRLLTAANDAVVTIWDLNEVLDGAKNARPRIAVTRDDLHSGGIFSAHTIGDRLVTASKDRAVVLSALAPDAIRPVRTFEVHGGVVKSAALRDAHVCASTGNDLRVAVLDAREAANGGCVATIDDAHDFAINSVSWAPNSHETLMTASFGAAIKLWDIRKVNEPIMTLRGHTACHRGGIYHPMYAAGGRSVVTPGAKTDVITIFDASDGDIVSRGETTIGSVAAMTICSTSNRMAASVASRIVILDPVF